MSFFKGAGSFVWGPGRDSRGERGPELSVEQQGSESASQRVGGVSAVSDPTLANLGWGTRLVLCYTVNGNSVYCEATSEWPTLELPFTRTAAGSASQRVIDESGLVVDAVPQ